MSEHSTGAPTTPLPLAPCPTCGRDVPPGEFCGACGAHILADSAGSASRHHAYAANPAEHVLHVNLVSTLFPHLPHRRSAPFRIALLVAAGLLLLFGLLGLTGPTVAAAALAVPVLYLVYLYEVEVYESEPVLVIGATFVLGLLLGIPWATFVGPLITDTATRAGAPGGLVRSFLLSGVIFPLVAQFLMLAGALVIYATRRYDEALDGFTFGAAGALGFTLSTTFVNLLPELQTGPISGDPLIVNVLDVLQRGLLLPFLNASTAGLIAGALWLRRGRTSAPRAHGWSTSLVAIIVIVVVIQAILGLSDLLAKSLIYAVSVRAVVAVAVLLLVRVALHHMLLAEAVDVAIGPSMPCFHCHRIVPRMAFCPHCGVATRATPKTGSGRLNRAVR